MNVESLRRHLLDLAEMDSPSAAVAVRELANALAPFDAETVPSLVRFLDQARNYRDQGSVKPTGTRGRKPSRSEAELEQERRAKADERDRKKRDADRLKQEERDRKAQAKQREADLKRFAKLQAAEARAELRRAAAAARAAQKAEPAPEVRQLVADLADLITRSKREQATFAEIDRHIDRLKSLTKPKLLQVAKLINSDAGLSAKPKGQMVKMLGDMLKQVLGTAQRVKM